MSNYYLKRKIETGNAKIELSYSQNFLHSTSLVKKLIENSSLNSEDIVYEIGPGKGIITKQLAKKCSKVVAIEYDKVLYENLKKFLGNENNIELIFGDFLKEKLPTKYNYKIFSNIPFKITAEILAKITSLDNSPEDSYLIIQEEAARKYSGFSSYGKESLRSLMIKPYFELSIIHKFRNTDFSPVPNVNIVLLRIKKREKFLLNIEEIKRYNDFISYAFSQHGGNLKERLKRVFTNEQFKRLAQNLRFDISVRPIQLKFEQWMGLFKYYIKGVSLEKQGIVNGASNRLVAQQKKIDKIHRNRNNLNNKIKKLPR